ncbi:MAG: hypothetical protein P1S46_04345 [bacterium]|nr:hypothetical protein [bacterium]
MNSIPKLDSVEAVLWQLKTMESAENRAGMGRFGIRVQRAPGGSPTTL